MAIPSLALIPTGYKDGKLYSVLPESGAGDFDVVRGSAATRVNAEGLIEDIRIISGELVTNGDFSNGGADWTLGAGWGIGNNLINFNNSTGTELSQALSTTIGKYKIKFDLNITSGICQTSFASPSTSIIESFTTSGTKEVIIETTSNYSKFRFVGVGGSDFTIANVSIIEITDATNIPRIDYTDGGCPSLLLEPQSTNLIPYSEDFSQWSTKTNISFTLNSAISPEGVNSADFINENSSNVQHFIGQTLSVTDGQSITISVYAKKNQRDVLQISPSGSHLTTSGYANYDLTNGLVTASGGGVIAEIEALTNNWYRCIMEFTANNSSSGTTAFFLQNSTTASRGASYQGDGTSGLYLWGAQIEALPYATSYIPTSGAIATRLADKVTGAGDVNTFNSTEGVLYAEMASLSNTVASNYIAISDGTYNNRLSIFFTNGTNIIRAFFVANGVVQANRQFTVSDITEFHKVAFKYKENDFALWIDGVEVGVDVSGSTLPSGTLTKLSFSEINSTANAFKGKVRDLRTYNTALTDAELLTLTTI